MKRVPKLCYCAFSAFKAQSRPVQYGGDADVQSTDQCGVYGLYSAFLTGHEYSVRLPACTAAWRTEKQDGWRRKGLNSSSEQTGPTAGRVSGRGDCERVKSQDRGGEGSFDITDTVISEVRKQTLTLNLHLRLPTTLYIFCSWIWKKEKGGVLKRRQIS